MFESKYNINNNIRTVFQFFSNGIRWGTLLDKFSVIKKSCRIYRTAAAGYHWRYKFFAKFEGVISCKEVYTYWKFFSQRIHQLKIISLILVGLHFLTAIAWNNLPMGDWAVLETLDLLIPSKHFKVNFLVFPFAINVLKLYF